jgi:hypothetical protein
MLSEEPWDAAIETLMYVHHRESGAVRRRREDQKARK